MKKILLTFLSCATLFTQAQKKDSLLYGGMQQLSLSFGQSGPTFGFALVNGVRFNRFFAGLGAEYRSRPYGMADKTAAFYVDGRYYINKNKNFFAKGDAGVNLILSESQFYYAESKFTKMPGFHGGLGVGFKARIGRELFYSFDVSYVISQSRYSFNYRDWRFPEQWHTETHDLRHPMILVNVGFEIF